MWAAPAASNPQGTALSVVNVDATGVLEPIFMQQLPFSVEGHLLLGTLRL